MHAPLAAAPPQHGRAAAREPPSSDYAGERPPAWAAVVVALASLQQQRHYGLSYLRGPVIIVDMGDLICALCWRAGPVRRKEAFLAHVAVTVAALCAGEHEAHQKPCAERYRSPCCTNLPNLLSHAAFASCALVASCTFAASAGPRLRFAWAGLPAQHGCDCAQIAAQRSTQMITCSAVVGQSSRLALR